MEQNTMMPLLSPFTTFVPSRLFGQMKWQHVKKVVGRFREKVVSVLLFENQETHRRVNDRHMTLAVEMASNKKEKKQKKSRIRGINLSKVLCL